MCVRPLKILSRKADKLPVFDELSYTVPCGHCEECKKVKRNQWFVRLYYQYKECIDKGGFALFLTLTFNNKNLPRCNGHACFGVENYQKFFKRFRSKLSRKYPNIDWKSNLKYALFEEYGGKTHRPHAHTIVYCLVPFPRWIFRTLLKNEWNCGYTKFGKRNYGFVDSIGGLKYCAKYVCKDVYEDKYLYDLTLKLKHEGVSDDDLKKFKPRVLCSNGLGLYGLELVPYDLLEKGKCLIEDSVYSEKSYKLPLYLERKLFYDIKYRYYDYSKKDYLYTSRKLDIPDDVDYIPVYVLNDRGISMKQKRFETFLNHASDTYRSSLFVLDADVSNINCKFNTSFESLDDVKEFCFKDFDEETFVNYVSVYRGCCPAGGDFSSLQGFSSSLSEDFVTSLSVKHGLFVDRVQLQSFLDNVVYYHNIPFIEDKTQIILYLHSLAQQSLDVLQKEKEMKYIDAKSVYLKLTEKYE